MSRNVFVIRRLLLHTRMLSTLNILIFYVQEKYLLAKSRDSLVNTHPSEYCSISRTTCVLENDRLQSLLHLPPASSAPASSAPCFICPCFICPLLYLSPASSAPCFICPLLHLPLLHLPPPSSAPCFICLRFIWPCFICLCFICPLLHLPPASFLKCSRCPV